MADNDARRDPANHQQSTLYRIASEATSVALAVGWLLVKLAFVAAPVIAFYLMSVLPSDGFGTLGLSPQTAEMFSIIGGCVVALSYTGWGVLTFIYLFSLDPDRDRDFDWYVERVGLFVLGIYACALTPAVVTLTLNVLGLEIT